MDFTLTVYKDLLTAFLSKGFAFQTVEQFITDPLNKVVILRHDVDRLPRNALKMARLEHEIGVASSYYFRAVPESYDTLIMEEIAGMGHEIGYHYENIDSVIKELRDLGIKGLKSSGIEELRNLGIEGLGNCGLRIANSELGKLKRLKRKIRKLNVFGKAEVLSEEQLNGVLDLAYEDFYRNLEMFRKDFDVQTICMHGSPLSRYDNRMIWEKYDYRELGIVAEPYFDVDFEEVFYLTDTGRKWNNAGASVRDKVNSGFDIPIKSTSNLIEMTKRQSELGRTKEPGVEEKQLLPNKMMINVHPQRWHDQPWPWLKELVGQKMKNCIKYLLIKGRSKSI